MSVKANASLVFIATALCLAAPALADTTIICESKHNAYAMCALPDHGYVYLSRQLSASPCQQGRSWDYDRRGIWVDDGCRAEFKVETRQYSTNDPGRHKGKDAAEAIVALGLIAALASSSKDKGDRYGDDNYGRGGHASYVPSWAVGQFYGNNDKYGGARVSLNIGANGRVLATVNGSNINGYLNDERLYIGDAEFEVSPTRDGLVTQQIGQPDNVVYYSRH